VETPVSERCRQRETTVFYFRTGPESRGQRAQEMSCHSPSGHLFSVICEMKCKCKPLERI